MMVRAETQADADGAIHRTDRTAVVVYTAQNDTYHVSEFTQDKQIFDDYSEGIKKYFVDYARYVELASTGDLE